MEESSNGRLEETPKVEAHDEEKEVVLEDSTDVEFVKEIVVDADGNTESVDKIPYEEDSSSSSSSSDEEEKEPEQKSPKAQVENSENFEEEKVVSDPVVESSELEPDISSTEELSKDMEPSVEKPAGSDVAELDAEESKENVSPSLDETNADSPILTDLPVNGSKGIDETTGDSALLTDVGSKGIDEETALLPGSDDDTNGSTVAVGVVSKGIEETTASCSAENGGVPAPVTQGITGTAIPVSDNSANVSSDSPDLASKENVEDCSQAANAPIVEARDAAAELVNKPEIPESTGNQPIISLNQRPDQPTSWKSCCGLFEVLRRSN